MNHFLKVSIYILLITLISCDKDNFTPDYSEGKATAIMNGEKWIAQGRGTVYSTGYFSFYFRIFNDIGYLRQDLFFLKVPKNNGKYVFLRETTQPLDSFPYCSYYTTIGHGDILNDVYNVVESKTESTITILSYDESSRILKGKFRIKFSIDPERQDPMNPDTIVFKNGQFTLKIEE